MIVGRGKYLFSDAVLTVLVYIVIVRRCGLYFLVQVTYTTFQPLYSSSSHEVLIVDTQVDIWPHSGRTRNIIAATHSQDLTMPASTLPLQRTAVLLSLGNLSMLTVLIRPVTNNLYSHTHHSATRIRLRQLQRLW